MEEQKEVMESERLEGEENSFSNLQFSTNAIDTPATLKDSEIVAERFYTLFGTSLKDDFYTAVNKEVGELSREYGRLDFSVSCNLGKDTMLSRIFKVMRHHTRGSGKRSKEK